MARPVAPRRAAVVLGAMALAGAMLAGLAPAAGAVPPACGNTLTLNQTTVSGNVPDDCAC